MLSDAPIVGGRLFHVGAQTKTLSPCLVFLGQEYGLALRNAVNLDGTPPSLLKTAGSEYLPMIQRPARTSIGSLSRPYGTEVKLVLYADEKFYELQGWSNEGHFDKAKATSCCL